MNDTSIKNFCNFSKNKVYLLLGSFPITDNKELYNRSILIDPRGDIISIYDKIHMFDITSEMVRNIKSDFYPLEMLKITEV